jgi:hypothetical protein
VAVVVDGNVVDDIDVGKVTTDSQRQVTNLPELHERRPGIVLLHLQNHLLSERDCESAIVRSPMTALRGGGTSDERGADARARYYRDVELGSTRTVPRRISSLVNAAASAKWIAGCDQLDARQDQAANRRVARRRRHMAVVVDVNIAGDVDVWQVAIHPQRQLTDLPKHDEGRRGIALFHNDVLPPL